MQLKRLVISSGLFGVLISVQCWSQSSGDIDWAPVAKALNDAEAAWVRDCPLGACSDATSDLHKARVDAYSRARTLLNSYIDNGAKFRDPKTIIRLKYRLGIVNEGAEDHLAAFSYFRDCAESAPADLMFKQDGRDQPLSQLCATASAQECKTLGSGCPAAKNLVTDSFNRPSRTDLGVTLSTGGGKTTSTNPNDFKPQDALGRLTPEQKKQMEELKPGPH